MLPHLGAGAGQCIEDAYLLGNLLSLPEVNIDNVEVSIYDRSSNALHECLHLYSVC